MTTKTPQQIRNEVEKEKKMREIKFRCWDKKKREMFIALQLKKDSVFNTITIPSTGFFRNFDFERYELMQFTGLKDLKDNNIYEGDIVKFNNEVNLKRKRKEIIGVIVNKVGWCFVVEFKEYNKILMEWEIVEHLNPTIEEVIGNIYENTELNPLSQEVTSND